MKSLSLIDKGMEINKAAKVIRAINHPLRKRILKLLFERSQAIVTEIYVYLRIEQSVASQHLKILRQEKIVETKRDGKATIYKLNYHTLTKLERIVTEIVTE